MLSENNLKHMFQVRVKTKAVGKTQRWIWDGMGQKMAEQKLHLHDLRSWPTR